MSFNFLRTKKQMVNECSTKDLVFRYFPCPKDSGATSGQWQQLRYHIKISAPTSYSFAFGPNFEFIWYSSNRIARSSLLLHSRDELLDPAVRLHAISIYDSFSSITEYLVFYFLYTFCLGSFYSFLYFFNLKDGISTNAPQNCMWSRMLPLTKQPLLPAFNHFKYARVLEDCRLVMAP